MKVGQIIPNAFLISQYITNIAKQPDVKTIIEIGTWNGLGSTRCVLDGLKDKTDYTFTSYECWTDMYSEAIVNNRDFLNEKFKIVNGKIINEEDIKNTVNKTLLRSDELEWLEQDLFRMSFVPNVLSAIPPRIDLLILDGGEFSTKLEWDKLKDRTIYTIFDDTKTHKAREIRYQLMLDNNYDIICDNPNERNGFLVVKRRNTNGLN